MRRLGIHDAATLGHDAFVARFGDVYDGAPWVAEGAWARGPFDTVAALRAALKSVVEEAAPERRAMLGDDPHARAAQRLHALVEDDAP